MEAEAPVTAENLKRILNVNKIGVRKIETEVGPAVTLYKVYPELGTRISMLRAIEDDITLSVMSPSVRAYLPYECIGIELANSSREDVRLISMLDSGKCLHEAGPMKLPVVLGMNFDRSLNVVDLTDLPHLLVAGSSGQGTDMAVHAVILSLLKIRPYGDVKFVLIDPKGSSMPAYERLDRTFLAGPDTLRDSGNVIRDSEGAEEALRWLCDEMDRRYGMLAGAKCMNISEYRSKISSEAAMPYIVTVFDEYQEYVCGKDKRAKGMMSSLLRLASKGRAAGIHIVLSTQRPSEDSITGLVKANFPSRLALRVPARRDSLLVIDQAGAEKLTGKGDAIFHSGEVSERVQLGSVTQQDIENFIGEMRTDDKTEQEYGEL